MAYPARVGSRKYTDMLYLLQTHALGPGPTKQFNVQTQAEMLALAVMLAVSEAEARQPINKLKHHILGWLDDALAENRVYRRRRAGMWWRLQFGNGGLAITFWTNVRPMEHETVIDLEDWPA